MRYLRQGSGPPLVLIHGLMGYSFSWRYVMPVLSRTRTVYALDLIGAGFSDRPRNLDCRLQPQAERVIQFLNQVGIGEFDLLGTSHGGAVSMMTASLVPRGRVRLRRLILSAPVNPWSKHGQLLAPALASRIGSALFLSSIAQRPLTHRLALERLYGSARNIPPGTLEGYSAPAGHPGFFEYGLKIAGTWNDDLRDLRSILPRIASYPTFLMWGELDRAVTVRSLTPLQKCFRQCDARVFDDIGHLPYEEAPDAFNEALLRFLQADLTQRSS
jgi:pimeloyl-ACP methyl ester carboxylesterase